MLKPNPLHESLSSYKERLNATEFTLDDVIDSLYSRSLQYSTLLKKSEEQEKIIEKLEKALNIINSDNHELKKVISSKRESNIGSFKSNFYLMLGDLVHNPSLKPGIRSAINELLIEVKKMRIEPDPEDALGKLFNMFGFNK